MGCYYLDGVYLVGALMEGESNNTCRADPQQPLAEDVKIKFELDDGFEIPFPL